MLYVNQATVDGKIITTSRITLTEAVQRLAIHDGQGRISSTKAEEEIMTLLNIGGMHELISRFIRLHGDTLNISDDTGLEANYLMKPPGTFVVDGPEVAQ